MTTTNETRVEAWPPLKKALWDVLMAEKLNDGYVRAFPLVDRLHEAALSAASAAPAQEPVLPDDIAEHVLKLGRAQWGCTEALDADGHAAHTVTSVTLTAECFGQTGPQEMHGAYLDGTDIVLAHTGTSPNSPMTARAMVGAWNCMHGVALGQSAPVAASAPAQEPVAHQWRYRPVGLSIWSPWFDGEPDRALPGEVEERALYTSPPAPVAASPEARKHAVELEQCSIFAADVGVHIAKSMTDAAAFLRSIAASPEAKPAPAVKALEWAYRELEQGTYIASDERGDLYWIDQSFGSDSYYFVTTRKSDGAVLYDGDDLPGAKSAAQSDYDRRVRACLVDGEAGGWRPIEEAPKDGRVVLGYWSPDNIETIAFRDGIWVWSSDHDSWREGSGPTHFMPLPSPPATGVE